MINFMVVDTETGGVDSSKDALLQVSAVICHRSLEGELKIDDEFTVDIAPSSGLKVSPEALSINKLNYNVLVKNGVPEFTALENFLRFANQYRAKISPSDHRVYFPFLIGWNLEFDISFLRAAFIRAKLEWPFYFRTFDVASLWNFQKLFIEGTAQYRGITEAASHFFDEPVTHHSLEDCRLTLRILQNYVGFWNSPNF